MISFVGLLPKLTDPLTDERLNSSVEDFLWKLKISNPNFIFVFGSQFKSTPKKDQYFTFITGNNNQYIKNKEISNQIFNKMQEHEVEYIYCNLQEENIDISDPYIEKIIQFFPEINIVFIEYPNIPDRADEYVELGQLLSVSCESENINAAFIAHGHLSATLDKDKLSFNRQAQELDDFFVDQLKTDMFSLFNLKIYSNVWDAQSNQPKNISNYTRQSLYEGTLILLSSLLGKIPQGETVYKTESKGFEIIYNNTLKGTHYLLSILYRESFISVDYNKDYEIDEYLELLLTSYLMNSDVSEDDIKLNLPKDFTKKGIFLSLYKEGRNLACIGDLDQNIKVDNIPHVLKLLVYGLLKSSTNVKLSDLISAKITVNFKDEGFEINKISNLEDLTKYNIFLFKSASGEKFALLEEKTLNNFLKLLEENKVKKETEVFGLA